MKDKYFLDTNIFIYTFDQEATGKNKKARQLVKAALSDNRGTISFQVVQEFLNVATRKFRTPLLLNDCTQYLNQVLSPLCEIFPSSDFYQKTLNLQNETGFAFYDTMILQAALDSGCKIILTEDLQDGRTVKGLTIKNPFK